MERESVGQAANRGRQDTARIQPATKEPNADKPGVQVNGSDLNRLAASAHRQSRVLLATVLSQTLKEMDRDL